MSAQLLALCCLLNLVVSSDPTGPSTSAGPELVVYLKSDQAQPSRTVEHMKVELTALMRSAGYRVDWRDPQAEGRTVDNADLVVAELRGVCGIPQGSVASDAAADRGGSLGSTYVSGDRVLPFSWLNCRSLTRLLGASLSSEAPAQRDFLYGRAMARLMAHELYHVIANTREHGREGIGKPAFTVKNLLSERFEFETESMAKLAGQRAPSIPSAGGESAADAPSGR